MRCGVSGHNLRHRGLNELKEAGAAASADQPSLKRPCTQRDDLLQLCVRFEEADEGEFGEVRRKQEGTIPLQWQSTRAAR